MGGLNVKKLRIDTLFFILFITALGIINLLNFNKPTESALENRALKEKPQLLFSSIIEGKYQKDYEEYYSDTFILRDNLVKTSKDVNKALAILGPDITLVKSYEDVQKPPEETQSSLPPSQKDPTENTNTPIPGENIQPTQEPVEITPTPTPEPDVEKDFGDGPNVGYWMVVDGKAVQLFKFNKESFDYYANILNKYSEKLGDDVKIYSMIPPTNSEFMQLRKYKGMTDSQNDALDYLKSKMDKSISLVDVFRALNNHNDEYIYFRTDHHWTARGAYYGYVSFMENRGETALSLNQFEEINLGDFLGSSYTKTLDKSLEDNPDNLTAYKPLNTHEFITYRGTEPQTADVIDLKYKDDISKKYLTFLSSGGASWSKIETDVNNGKKLLVIKDSFGNAFVPFLVPHYEEIYVVDSRFYNMNLTGNIVDFVKDNGINEVVFCIYMEDVNWYDFMSGVEKLLGETN